MGVIASSGLLVQAQPALFDGGAEGWVTEGQSWEFVFDNWIDASGSPLSTGTLTPLCRVYDKPVDGAVLLTMDCTWSTVSGKTRLTVRKDDSATAGLAGNSRSRTAYWSLKISDVTDSLLVWGPSNSILHIASED